MISKKSLLISAALSSLLAASAYADTGYATGPGEKPVGQCHGVNACKGHGACKGAGHTSSWLRKGGA